VKCVEYRGCPIRYAVSGRYNCATFLFGEAIPRERRNSNPDPGELNECVTFGLGTRTPPLLNTRWHAKDAARLGQVATSDVGWSDTHHETRI
jgi:hypothetical protein